MKVAGLIMLVHGNMGIADRPSREEQQGAKVLSCYPLS